MESFRTADGRTLAYRRTGIGADPRLPSGRPRLLLALLRPTSPARRRVHPRPPEPARHPRAPTGPRIRAPTRPTTTSPTSTSSAQHLGLERMLLLGHSHGGVVAAGLRRRPSRIASSASSSPARSPASRPSRTAAMEAADRGEGRRALVRGRAGGARGRAGGPTGGRTRSWPRSRCASFPSTSPSTASRARVPEAARRRDPRRRRAQALQRRGLHDVRPPTRSFRGSPRRRS